MAVVLLLLAGAGGGWWWWQSRQAGENRAAGRPGSAGQAGGQAAGGREAGGERVPVETALAESRDVPIYYNSLGTVQAFNTVLVRPRVDGEIVRIAFQEGQMVKEGDLLAQIDPRPYRATLDGALARKAQNEATLVSNRADLERTQQLARREFATQQSLDQQTSNVRSQQAVIAADQAAIDSAQTQLDYTTIRSPLSGRTGLRLVDQGNVVRAGDSTGIVEIAQLQPISVLFTAPEGQLSAIAEAMGAGDVAVMALATSGGAVLGQGRLALINNQVDVATGTVRLKATFPNDEGRLWPGLSVNTRLLVRTLKGVVAVPEDALQRGQNELFVYVVKDDGTAEKRVVSVGPFSEGRVVVTEHLKPGERVVTVGQSRLQPGSRLDLGQGRDARPEGGRMAERTSSAGAGQPVRASP